MNRRDAIQRTALILGYAVSAPALMGILKGCKAAPELNYQPVFLSEEQAGVVSELAEILLPKTDTPGAKDVGVPRFIDQVVNECYAKEDQDRFLQGLQKFDEDARKAFGDSFVYGEPADQLAFVKQQHDEAVAMIKADPSAKRPFILMVKELTLLGYFTSEPGATQVLQYEPVPGAYHGCVPLTEVGKTWATS
ncbi:MAG: gluconate 2-dehydrogenase subunit 3 family protein [Cyclobacteriaceae bacterium]|jgi:gluconate 2-dehydrogenase gamma chain